MISMLKLRRWLTISLIVLSPSLLAACERELSEAEAKVAISRIEPKVDEFFRGLEEGDYLIFSSGFDSYMLKSIPGNDFSEFRRDLNGKLGSYLSREVLRAVQADEYYVVEYAARFKREGSVSFSVAFHRAEPNTINHVWIESDNATWAPEPIR
jgi:hypothetical protein